ncbi:hypothetical protein HZS_3270 [Henneguya salminicola]|nr:hypothetical protein HZS_3270 [Henneguya salminicola]
MNKLLEKALKRSKIEKIFILFQNYGTILPNSIRSDDHEPSKVSKALENTLTNLKLYYLYMYLIHNPCRTKNRMEPLWYSKQWVIETWREMI